MLKLIFIFICLINAACTDARQLKIDLEIQKGVKLPISIYLPSKSPKALIVVSPGSGGDGQFDLLYQLRQKKMNFDSQGGLVDLFTSAGYGIVFITTRGHQWPSQCIEGESFKDRLISSYAKCLDSEIRVNYDLEAAISDNLSVYEYLKDNPEFANIPLISMAISEGSYHIARLVSAEKIQPSGIIYIGGLSGSISENFDHRFANTYYFEKIKKTFEVTGKTVISARDVAFHTNVDLILEQPFGPPHHLVNAMGGVTLTFSDLPKRIEFYEKLSKEFKNKMLAAASVTPLSHRFNYGGDIGILEIPVFAAGNYMQQFYKEKTPTSEYLKNYKFPVKYIFGNHDWVVQLPKENFCSQQKFDCEIEFVDGVDHVLADKSGIPPKHALETLLRNVKSIPLKK